MNEHARLGPDEASIPLWAAGIQVSIAKIEGVTSQIPALGRAIEELRANTVPMKEHLELMTRVDELWNRDLSARSEWDEVCERVPVLWEDRVKRAGTQRAHRWWLGALSVAVAVLTALTLFHSLGVGISFH